LTSVIDFLERVQPKPSVEIQQKYWACDNQHLITAVISGLSERETWTSNTIEDNDLQSLSAKISRCAKRWPLLSDKDKQDLIVLFHMLELGAVCFLLCWLEVHANCHGSVVQELLQLAQRMEVSQNTEIKQAGEIYTNRIANINKIATIQSSLQDAIYQEVVYDN